MENHANQSQSRRIYDKNLKEWFDVPANYYEEYNR